MAAVVVGAGPSPGTQRAVRWAAGEAEVRRRPLTVVHAWPDRVDLSVEVPGGVDPDLPCGATCRGTCGSPAAAVLAEPADLVVLGGRAGASHPSSVVSACLHSCRVPLVVVPHGAPAEPQRVVVALCGTAASSVALAWARCEASLRGLPLTAVYAWQRGPALHSHDPRALQGTQEAQSRLRAWTSSAGAEAQGGPDVELLATQGPPLETLLATVREDDLLVVGRPIVTRGATRFLHGDLGADLAGLVPCPVALVPSAPR